MSGNHWRSIAVALGFDLGVFCRILQSNRARRGKTVRSGCGLAASNGYAGLIGEKHRIILWQMGHHDRVAHRTSMSKSDVSDMTEVRPEQTPTLQQSHRAYPPSNLFELGLGGAAAGSDGAV